MEVDIFMSGFNKPSFHLALLIKNADKKTIFVLSDKVLASRYKSHYKGLKVTEAISQVNGHISMRLKNESSPLCNLLLKINFQIKSTALFN